MPSGTSREPLITFWTQLLYTSSASELLSMQRVYVEDVRRNYVHWPHYRCSFLMAFATLRWNGIPVRFSYRHLGEERLKYMDELMIVHRQGTCWRACHISSL